MYEFQLYCQDDEELRSGGGGAGGGGGVGLAKPPTAFGSRASSKKEAEAWLAELRSQKDEL